MDKCIENWKLQSLSVMLYVDKRLFVEVVFPKFTNKYYYSNEMVLKKIEFGSKFSRNIKCIYVHKSIT